MMPAGPAGEALISSKSDHSPEKNRINLHANLRACCVDRIKSEENNDLPSGPFQQSPDCEDTLGRQLAPAHLAQQIPSDAELSSRKMVRCLE